MRRRLRKGGDSINSFMAWVGGKKALRDEILARFPRNYKRYIEVFGGAGWVLFHKPPGNDFEVFNDFNGNLVNLYRCVREQPEALRNELRYMLNSRLDFEYTAGRLLLCADPVQLRSWDLDLRQPAPCHVEQLSADRIGSRQAAKGRHRKQGLCEAHPAV